jgi:hypothetical protein
MNERSFTTKEDDLMGKIVMDMSMLLDDFIAATHDTPISHWGKTTSSCTSDPSKTTPICCLEVVCFSTQQKTSPTEAHPTNFIPQLTASYTVRRS